MSDIENARVDINGEILDDLGEEVILDETDAVDIDVERINPDAPFRVAFMVIDECNGPFYTRPFGGPAQPTPTPTSTSTPTP